MLLNAVTVLMLEKHILKKKVCILWYPGTKVQGQIPYSKFLSD